MGSKNQTEATTFTKAGAETVRAAIGAALTTRHGVEKERESKGQEKGTVVAKREEAEKSSKVDGNESCIKRSAGLRGRGIRLPAAPGGFQTQLEQQEERKVHLADIRGPAKPIRVLMTHWI